MGQIRLRRAAGSALAIVCLLAASCSSDESDGTGSTGTSTGDTGTTTGTGGTGTTTGTGSTAAASPCLVDGDGPASGTPIKLGSIQGISGPDDFGSAGKGAAAFFACVNAHGGIGGRPVELLVEDDQWTPEVAAAAATKLVVDEQVLVMVGSSSFVECGVNAALYEDNDIVSVTGTGVPKECFFSANIAPTNSGPRISTIGIAEYMVDTYDGSSIACLAPGIPNVGEWMCAGLSAWGEEHGVEVQVVTHDPGNPDFNTVMQTAMSTDPDIVILAEPAGLAVGLMKVAEEQDLAAKAHFGGPTSTYLATLPKTVGSYWWGRFDVQAELAPIDATSPDNQAWLATMDQYGSASDPRDTFSQSGWLAAKVVTTSLLQLDPSSIDRAALTEALRGIDDFPSDLMCGTWYFGPGDRHNANHAGRIVTIDDTGSYVQVRDCAEVGDPELADVLAAERAG